MSALKRLESPFSNDPFSLVWEAFKNLYPGKECEVWYDQHNEEGHENEYGCTLFPDDGSAPVVSIFAEHPVNILVEILGHELAHVAVGQGHDHDEEWEKAFDEIFMEYTRLSEARYGAREKEEER